MSIASEDTPLDDDNDSNADVVMLQLPLVVNNNNTDADENNSKEMVSLSLCKLSPTRRLILLKPELFVRKVVLVFVASYALLPLLAYKNSLPGALPDPRIGRRDLVAHGGIGMAGPNTHRSTGDPDARPVPCPHRHADVAHGGGSGKGRGGMIHHHHPRISLLNLVIWGKLYEDLYVWLAVKFRMNRQEQRGACNA
ncbi:hypothetical protein FRACYDRAFT_254181 [Fragilariopsis cylindrus CCMP1102]|uniref:Uncharacterized protein n=1 Tax=Fragilariopsis cylindrus CCMP1102 TaxID=635003 RepID=A0A1E7EL39_9STRA|nr:hypothetical protein FRACYDRAFT_254181 [Fragilariopsis cylindrus CCMP1102]|eukprot:OEU06630.1 hypothetical protein FRACYDRAFT_254181 [Fragilariopsis cylindrus CCMP1102]